MQDADFWKKRYQSHWHRASQREQAIQARIQAETGRDVVFSGLGAGSQTFLRGSAQQQGYEKGEADLQVVPFPLFLEITGPQSRSISRLEPLWIRPDKVTHARQHYPARQVWVVHWLEQDGTLRVIPLNDLFFYALDQGQFPLVQPSIRGVIETYLEIPAQHVCVHPWEWLIAHIQALGASGAS